jgi:hypothetical protein
MVAGCVVLAVLLASKGFCRMETTGTRSLRLPDIRDMWVSNVGNEADANLGGASRLKLKSTQEQSLIDFDPYSIRGQVVESAALHIRLTGKERLRRVTVSTLAADWVEGTSSRYRSQRGSSTFNARQYPDVPWAYPGSDFTAVAFGEGGTVWGMADASAPDGNGWQSIPLDPRVVASRVAGVSYGLVLFDDTGSEWSRDGERFAVRLYPNRFVSSREAGAAKAPYLTVVLGETDVQSPGPPVGLSATAEGLPAGEARIAWITPEDRGVAGTIGFFATTDGSEIPRYLIPAAGVPGERVEMHLRDLGFLPGQTVTLSVRAVDGAGNVGESAESTFAVSKKESSALPAGSPVPFTRPGPLPRVGGVAVAVIDPLDKVQPVTGAMVPSHPEGYLSANHLWSAQEKRVRLCAARNEFVSFQIVLRGNPEAVRPSLRFEEPPGSLETRFYEFAYVRSPKGPMPDPVVPLDRRSLEQGAGTYQSLLCEIYVPHGARSGKHQGVLVLSNGTEKLALDVDLHIWDFTLPDYLSFIPEMNCYSLPANERDYYRLAHRHRTVLNRVPYSQAGRVASGCAPGLDGSRLDWSKWDARFAPYLDGSAFADLPRGNVPLERFYLPLHENWPSPIEPHYNGGYWADQALSGPYRDRFVETARGFARHFAERGWHDTLFQVYLNNKSTFKRRGWSHGSSPWLLDEPANFQDFWALRYFAKAFHEGRNTAAGAAKLLFRADISKPEWEKGSLDGLLDYYVVNGSALRRYQRLVLDRKRRNGLILVDYGSANGVEESNVQPAAWCLDSWALGAHGVLPWQTMGSRDSWEQADPLSLFYPGDETGTPEPIPSIRLKAFRRGQQDVEYLNLYSRVFDEPRWAVGEMVHRELGLASESGRTAHRGDEDAGAMNYGNLKPQDLWRLRTAVGAALSRMRPAAKRRLVEFSTPSRVPAALRDPMVPASNPDR